MKQTTLHSKVLPSLLAGASRHPLPHDLVCRRDSSSDGALELLSLSGQALRFERPPTPEHFLVEPELADERKIIPDDLRRPMIRLLTAKNSTDHPARALARAFDQLRMRPHPFDLPLVDSFVRTYAEKLGPTAQRWADRQKSDAQAQSYFDPESLDESNWTQATLGRRVAYFEQKRRENADLARTLLESAWSQEEAESRFRLLQAFQTGLSLADQPFLSTLEKDRAPRVRALAARYLSRVGVGTENPALGAVLERLKQGKSGLLRRRAALQLELPANVKDQTASQWVRETFSDISFADLAGALKLTDDGLIEAAENDQYLLLGLAIVATFDRRLDLLAKVLAHLPDAWQKLLESGIDNVGLMSESERMHWADSIVRPQLESLPTSYFLWDWLHRVSDCSLSTSVMSRMLESRFLGNVPERERDTGYWFELMAAMCPPNERQKLRVQLGDFEATQTVTAHLLLDILDEIENANTKA